MTEFDLIVWDWDGTLADSTGMITRAVVKAAEQAGLPPLAPEKATSIIGLGLRESIYTLFGELPDEQAQAVAKYYNANYYAEEHAIPLFSGAKETIMDLNRRGTKLAVATGKGRRGLNLALERSGLVDYFDATRTVDECFSKPHPQMLQELMDEIMVAPERTLMVGDTGFDLQMAQNAGVHAVGVTFGAHPRERLLSYNPRKIFHRFDELRHWLLGHDDASSTV